MVTLGKSLSKTNGSFDKTGIGARAGAAIDTDSFDLVHALHVALQRKKLKSGNLLCSRGISAKMPPDRRKIYLSRLYAAFKHFI